MKTIKIKNQTCLVQTLSEWLQSRIEQIRQANKPQYYEEYLDHSGRLVELGIILEKINDGRIQEIGEVEFRRK